MLCSDTPFSREKTCIASMRKEKKADAMQRYTIFDRKACVADRDQVRRMWLVQRHTISREKTCIASMGRKKKGRCDAATHHFEGKIVCRDKEKDSEKAAMQRYTFFDRKACVADRDQVRRIWIVQRHTISREKTCVASTEREKKTNRSHTTLHNTIRSSHKTTTHHITSYHNHIQTRQHYQQTTPIPYLKHHTPPHYTTKSSSPETRGRALLICLRTD